MFKEKIIERIVHCLKLVAMCCAAVSVLIYAFHVDIRRAAHDCKYEKSTEDQGEYTAEICYTYGNWLRFRLYKTGEGELLAERILEDPNDPTIDPLLWLEDRVDYDRDEGRIKLPPTWLDRFRAKLP